MQGWQAGKLEPYWEQGMEGSFLYSCALPECPGPFLLAEGDLLDILSAQGEVLWTGTYRTRKRRFWERHQLPMKAGSNICQRGLSYAQWMEWFWSSPPLPARVCRPGEDDQIVYATIDRHGGRPLRFRDAGPGRMEGRTILSWSANRGSYGMGGPGFFGLELSAGAAFPKEWLVLTLWGATDWLLLDGTRFSSHPRYYDEQKPLYSNFGGDQEWDQVTALLTSGVLAGAEIGRDWTKLEVVSKGETHTLELPSDKDGLSRFGGSEESRRWREWEEMQDAWVFTTEDLSC